MLRRLRDALLAHDPGLQRTYLAGRATLSVAVALAVAYGLGRAAGLPGTAVLLTVSVAMASSTAPAGTTRRAQLRTAGLMALAAAASVTLAVLLAPWPFAGYAAFVGVMAAGAWAGRFGPRGFGVGMVGFMTFFFALFTRATLPALPGMLAATALGIVISTLLRTVVLADRPARRLRRLLAALRMRAARLERPARRPDREAARVDEVVLPLHDLLRDAPETIGDRSAFRLHLFAVVTLGHFLVLRAANDESVLAAPPSDAAERLRAHLESLEALAAGRADPHPPDARRDGAETPEGDADLPPETLDVPMMRTAGASRTALQVAVAGAAAVAMGYAVSPQRWYWAAMSAFVVFTNTGSRGATLRKALERLLGTAAGVVAGMLAGYLLAGRRGVELVALFPLLFLAFWMLPVSYAVMVGTITVLLALMYDLMGMLTPDVLLLRLGETAFGAAAGALVAYLVLPTRTRSAVDGAFDGYFAALDGLLDALAETGRGAREVRVLDAARGLDRALAGLRGAVRPVVAAVPGRRSRALRQELLLAMAMRFWVHRLAAAVVFHAPDDTRLRALADVRERLRRLRDGEDATVPPAEADVARSGPLQRVDALLAELARARAERP